MRSDVLNLSSAELTKKSTLYQKKINGGNGFEETLKQSVLESILRAIARLEGRFRGNLILAAFKAPLKLTV